MKAPNIHYRVVHEMVPLSQRHDLYERYAEIMNELRKGVSEPAYPELVHQEPFRDGDECAWMAPFWYSPEGSATLMRAAGERQREGTVHKFFGVVYGPEDSPCDEYECRARRAHAGEPPDVEV